MSDELSSSLTTSIFGDSAAPSSSVAGGLFDTKSKQKLDEVLYKKKRQRIDTEAIADGSEAQQEPLNPKEILKRRQQQASHSILEQLTLKRQDDEPEAAFAEEISSTLKTYGVAVVENVFDHHHEQFDRLVQESQQWRRKICRALEQRNLSWTEPLQSEDDAIRFWEVALRCQGRMDVRYVNGGDDELSNNDSNIWDHSSLLQSTIQTLLDGGSQTVDAAPKLVYAGWIFSFPGESVSVDQPWHQDGLPLFPTDISQQLPPYAVNVFIPLETGDAALASGPTEFVVGSHRLDADAAMRATTGTDQVDDDHPVISPILQRGDILLYDYRTCHRGTANLTAHQVVAGSNNSKNDRNSGRVRTILYLMYARPWFREHLNFGPERLLPQDNRNDM